MSIAHEQAIWELCRQGYPICADEAERCWLHGKPYRPNVQMKPTRTLQTLIDQCNWEIARQREGVKKH